MDDFQKTMLDASLSQLFCLIADQEQVLAMDPDDKERRTVVENIYDCEKAAALLRRIRNR